MQPPQQPHELTAGRAAALVVAAVIVVAIAAKSSSKPTPPRPLPRLAFQPGDAVRLSEGWVYVSKEAYDAARKAVAATDVVGLKEVWLTGQAFAVEANTSALVREWDVWEHRVEVRILSGQCSGMAGWVPQVQAQRIQPTTE